MRRNVSRPTYASSAPFGSSPHRMLASNVRHGSCNSCPHVKELKPKPSPGQYPATHFSSPPTKGTMACASPSMTIHAPEHSSFSLAMASRGVNRVERRAHARKARCVCVVHSEKNGTPSSKGVHAATCSAMACTIALNARLRRSVLPSIAHSTAAFGSFATAVGSTGGDWSAAFGSTATTVARTSAPIPKIRSSSPKHPPRRKVHTTEFVSLSRRTAVFVSSSSSSSSSWWMMISTAPSATTYIAVSGSNS